MMDSRRRIEEWRLPTSDDHQEHLRADLSRALQTPLYLPTDPPPAHHHHHNHRHRATLAGIPSHRLPPAPVFIPPHPVKPGPSSPEILRQALASALCLSPRLSRVNRVSRRNTVPYLTSLQQSRLEEQRQRYRIEESSEDEASSAGHLFYLSPSSSNSSTGSRDDEPGLAHRVESSRCRSGCSGQCNFQNQTSYDPNNHHQHHQHYQQQQRTAGEYERRSSDGEFMTSREVFTSSTNDWAWRRGSADGAQDADGHSNTSSTFTPSHHTAPTYFPWPPALGESWHGLAHGSTFPPAYPTSFPYSARHLYSRHGPSSLSDASTDSRYDPFSFSSTSSLQSLGELSASMPCLGDLGSLYEENASVPGAGDSWGTKSKSIELEGERPRPNRPKLVRQKKQVTFAEVDQPPAVVDTPANSNQTTNIRHDIPNSNAAADTNRNVQEKPRATETCPSHPPCADCAQRPKTLPVQPQMSMPSREKAVPQFRDTGMISPPNVPWAMFHEGMSHAASLPNVMPHFPHQPLDPRAFLNGTGFPSPACGQCKAREAASQTVHFAPIGHFLFDMLTKKPGTPTSGGSSKKAPPNGHNQESLYDSFKAGVGCCQACKERAYRNRRMPSDPGACSHWSTSVHVRNLTAASTPEESWKALRDFISCQSRQVSSASGFPWSQGHGVPEYQYPSSETYEASHNTDQVKSGASNPANASQSAAENSSGDSSHNQLPAEVAPSSQQSFPQQDEPPRSPRRSPSHPMAHHYQNRRQHQQQLQREQQEHLERHQQQKLQQQQQHAATKPGSLQGQATQNDEASRSRSRQTGSDLDELYLPVKKGHMMEMSADFILFCIAIRAAFAPQPVSSALS